MPLLMPAASQERLIGASSGAAAYKRVEIDVNFVATLLNGATQRSNGDCSDWRCQPPVSRDFCGRWLESPRRPKS
jgi:hypothetical protein